MQIGVSAYSFPFGCGFMQRGGRSACAVPVDAFALATFARQWGLASVEGPLTGLLPDRSPSTVDRFRATLTEANLDLVVDTGVIDVAQLREILPVAARAGARVVRAMVSTILEGARWTVPGGWPAYLEQMQARLRALRPLLEEYDLTLAIENHQDTTSDDLLALCEAGGERVGVTLDVANPLAVGEEPLAFARKVGLLIRNVHLKDYRIYPSDAGFRLVRCALGDGVIPFPALLTLLAEMAPAAPLHIELAALHARHIRLLEETWWQGYPPQDVRAVLPVLRFAARHARPAADAWQTPWEQERAEDEVGRYEQEQFAHSIAYLRSIGALA